MEDRSFWSISRSIVHRDRACYLSERSGQIASRSMSPLCRLFQTYSSRTAWQLDTGQWKYWIRVRVRRKEEIGYAESLRLVVRSNECHCPSRVRLLLTQSGGSHDRNVSVDIIYEASLYIVGNHGKIRKPWKSTHQVCSLPGTRVC